MPSVIGESDVSGQPGVLGISADAPGVEGRSTTDHGVVGRSQNGNGIVGHSSGAGEAAGMFGEHFNNGTGVRGRSAGGHGVFGTSQTDHGVMGTSDLGNGVVGITSGDPLGEDAGVFGDHRNNGTGVRGKSIGGKGVFGTSETDHGVMGTSEGANGVVGISRGNPSGGNAGVFGDHRNNGTGVVGKSQRGDGVHGLSENGIGILGRGGRLAGRFEGDVEVTGDVRLTNGDCAEDFDIANANAIEPGTVMVLGDEGPLRASLHAYDKRVAGVVSGAGDYKPAIVLDKRPSRSDRMPIALLGKVFCKVDADYAPIEVGDLLTTSDTPGHAMKAADASKAFGAVIGKALRPLKEGRALIPILIALQ